jgi:hypothetical protein
MSRLMLRLTNLTIVAIAELDNYYSALPRPGADHGIIVDHQEGSSVAFSNHH